MGKIYGYCRISSAKQNIDRQIRNIKKVYENAYIVPGLGDAGDRIYGTK